MPPLNQFSRSCLALAIGQAMVMPVEAATITVNTTGDVDGGGPCTLREAITSIQDNDIAETGCNYVGLFGVDDTVNFDPGLSGQTILLGQATSLKIDDQLTNNLTINGLGENLLTIDGNGESRVFSIISSVVTLNDLMISGGNGRRDEADTQTYSFGGGISAIYYSTVSLNNVTVSGNTADFGGAIETSGTFSLNNVTVSGNTANVDGGGIRVLFCSTANITNSEVSLNSAGENGGGIWAALDCALSLSLSNSTVSGNSAAEIGGGIYSISSSVSITNSVVSGNSAASTAGGIRADASKVTLQNVTVSNNSAISTGGISAVNSADVIISNSTVSGNSGGLFNGGIAANISRVSLSNSIVAGNRAPNNAEVLNFGSNFRVSNGNLFGDAFHINDAAAFGDFSPGFEDINANSTDGLGMPLATILEPLGDNGGPTQTHALVVDSPAIDAGNNASCLDTDQRGQRRSDGECDIGAYEFIESNIFVVPLPNGRVVIFEL